MPLFSILSPEFYDEKDRDMLSYMEAVYAKNITINQSYWGEADTDERFYSNDQTMWNDLYGNLPANRRRQFTFNRIRRVVDMVSGHQRRNRKSTLVIPIENADQETADQYTKIFYWLDQQEQISETISKSFQGALVTGMNLLHVWMDYRQDPISGMPRVDNCSYNSFLIDPYFRKADLSDCQNIWKRTFINRREAISLLPGHEDMIMGMTGGSNGTGRDGKFQYMPESYNMGYKDLFTYDEFYYRDYRTQQILVDTQTGETLEWKSDDKDSLKLFLSTYPQITVIEQEVTTVKLCIVLQGKVMYNGPQPNGSDLYPFIPVFAYYSPQMPYFPYRIQGMVRGLRDAQYLYNRRRVIELDILESQINSGFIYKENALVNPKDVFLSGQGRGLALKKEASMTDVQQIQPPNVPPSMIELSQLLAREVMEISGVNEELLGSADDSKAGILSMLRQGAGLTTLQGLFDQLDQAQKLLGKLLLDLVNLNFTPGKIKRILNEEPSPQFYQRSFGKYDCAIEEGFNTTTQKQLQFAQLLQLRELGVPIPDENLIEAATLQDKNKLIQAMQQQKQAVQEQQQQAAQIQQQEIMARTNLANARAAADQGLGMERISRIQENQALAQERKAEAHKDDEQAVLNRVKALKELDSISLDQLEKLLRIKQSLQNENNEASDNVVRGAVI